MDRLPGIPGSLLHSRYLHHNPHRRKAGGVEGEPSGMEEVLDADDIGVRRLHFLDGSAALAEDGLPEGGAEGCGAVFRAEYQPEFDRPVRVHRFVQAAAEELHLLRLAVGGEGNAEIAIAKAQPVHPTGGVLREDGARTVPVQEHHALCGIGREEGGSAGATPFTQETGKVGRAEQTVALRYADAFGSGTAILVPEEAIQPDEADLAGRGEPLREQQIAAALEGHAAVQAEQLRVPG